MWCGCVCLFTHCKLVIICGAGRAFINQPLGHVRVLGEGMYLRIIKRMGVDMQNPRDIAELLISKLRPHFLRQGMEFACHIVTQVRHVEAMFPKVVHFHGAYKTRNENEAPHSFVFVPRGWLSAPLQACVKQDHPFKQSNNKFDIVVLVRQWMSDESLSQPPLLAVPFELRSDAIGFIRKLNNSPIMQVPTLTDERKAELLALRGFLMCKYPRVHDRAAKYYDELVVQDQPENILALPTVKPLLFLQCPRDFARLRPEIRNVIVPSALVPFQLKVVYQRGLRAIVANR
jgi:hypothetical protein